MYPQELAHARRQLKRGDKGEVRGNILPLKRGADGELSLAVPQMLRDAGVGLLDLLAGTRTGEVTPEATGLLFDIAGGGAASAPLRSTGLGIFGGKLAKTADHGALKRAEQMAGEGADRGTIWNDTGWFQGADGKWRFEIDDSQAKLTDWQKDVHGQSNIAWPGRDGPPQGMSTPDWIDHPELERAYWPTRDQSPSVFYDNLEANLGEYRGGSQDMITMNNRTRLEGDEGRETGLHELQHAIQQRENFARGGSSAIVARMQTEAEQELSRIRGEAQDWFLRNRENPDPLQQQAYQKAIDDAEAKVALLAGGEMDQYNRLAGETEARNVQTRRDMTPEERRARPPWETQDVPDEQQIVRFASGPSLMASIAKGTANQAGKGDRLNPDSLLGKVAAGKGDRAGVESDAMTFDFANPGGGSRTAKVGDTEITYGVGKNGLVELILIKTPKAKRGEGSARKALDKFVSEADAAGLRVALNADPMDKGVTKPRLERLYKAAGFKKNKGRNKDFETRAEFIRLPRTR